jgi:hypothetical protein
MLQSHTHITIIRKKARFQQHPLERKRERERERERESLLGMEIGIGVRKKAKFQVAVPPHFQIFCCE